MMKRFFIRFWPVIFIGIVWILFGFPYFFKGLVPYPSKYQVTFFAPWSYYQEWAGPVKNNAMPDIITQIYPWKHFTIEWLKQGVIPYWNPYNFAGTPHVANFQSAVFSPFNLLYFLLPYVDAWSINILFQPLLAALFMYLFLKSLKISDTGAVLGSITFMFCGFIVVWMAYGTLGMGIAFLPLALYGIERGFATGKKRYFLLMSFSIAVSFFSGHVQTSLYMAMFTLAYLLFKSIPYLSTLTSVLFLYKKKGYFMQKLQLHTSPLPLLPGEGDQGISFIVSRGIIKLNNTSIWALLFFLLGIGVSLIQVYPTFQLYQQSPRSGSLHVGGGIPWNYLPTIFAPDFFGNPVTRNDWVGSYAEWASFVGILPLVLAVLALGNIRDKRVLFFAIASAVTLILAMETPIHGLLIASHIPVLATSIPSRMIVLFSFAIAVLCGFGIDDLQKHIMHKKSKQVFPAILIIGSVLLCIWIAIVFFNVLPTDRGQRNIAIKNLILPTILFCTYTLFVFFSIFSKWKKIVLYVGYAVLLLASLDSYRFASKWMPFDLRSLVFPETGVVNAMEKNIGYGRVFGNLGAQVETYYGLGSLEGYDPLYIGRYGEFIRYASYGVFQPAERSVVKVNRTSPYTDKVLDLLGVHLIYHPLADTGQVWAYPVWKDYEKYSVIYQDDKFQIYKNNTALPRAKLYYAYEVIPDGMVLLKRFFSEDFDFRNILLLEEKVDIPSQSGEITQGTAKIVSYTPNVVKITVSTPESGLLFLSDAYYPNWKVTVNGKKQKIYRANYAFRAVEVEAGESVVEFSYRL